MHFTSPPALAIQSGAPRAAYSHHDPARAPEQPGQVVPGAGPCLQQPLPPWAVPQPPTRLSAGEAPPGHCLRPVLQALNLEEHDIPAQPATLSLISAPLPRSAAAGHHTSPTHRARRVSRASSSLGTRCYKRPCPEGPQPRQKMGRTRRRKQGFCWFPPLDLSHRRQFGTRAGKGGVKGWVTFLAGCI